MARFFIHIHNGSGPQIDETGSDFADGRLAISAAAKMAGEILSDETRDGVHDRTLRLVVEADDHLQIAEIGMTLCVVTANIR